MLIFLLSVHKCMLSMSSVFGEGGWVDMGTGQGPLPQRPVIRVGSWGRGQAEGQMSRGQVCRSQVSGGMEKNGKLEGVRGLDIWGLPGFPLREWGFGRRTSGHSGCMDARQEEGVLSLGPAIGSLDSQVLWKATPGGGTSRCGSPGERAQCRAERALGASVQCSRRRVDNVIQDGMAGVCVGLSGHLAWVGGVLVTRGSFYEEGRQLAFGHLA